MLVGLRPTAPWLAASARGPSPRNPPTPVTAAQLASARHAPLRLFGALFAGPAANCAMARSICPGAEPPEPPNPGDRRSASFRPACPLATPRRIVCRPCGQLRHGPQYLPGAEPPEPPIMVGHPRSASFHPVPRPRLQLSRRIVSPELSDGWVTICS